MQKKKVLIVGAGPAGLTAALELLRRSDIQPVLFESLDDVGGISRTINHLGNRMDIGGHRFFSKSDWVMNWWRTIMPIAPDKNDNGMSIVPEGDNFMLIRPRLSRIYFLRRFFDYPVSLSAQTMLNLGFWRLTKIGFSYLWICAFPRKHEKNLEDFFTNRFGGELYRTFFKDYTEKVWGVPCREISPDWGAQRVKGLSVMGTLIHAFKKLLPTRAADISQKKTNTSLIERFLYPKLGPGQMWQIVAAEVIARGGEIHHGHTVNAVQLDNGKVVSVDTVDRSGQTHRWQGEWLISTMPVRDLFDAMQPPPPPAAHRVAKGLCYRDFITMGLLLSKIKPTKDGKGPLNLVPDTWIYIQEPDVKIGRLQIFNNWSPALVRDRNTIWIGLEYFCQENDGLWSKSDEEFSRFAIAELAKINLIDSADVLDWHVERIPKAYPAYFGTYNEFDTIREFTDTIPNLFLVGRNGMHRYNNQDHSMLTANLAVESILGKKSKKDAIWTINVDDEYHEEKKDGSNR